MDQSYENNHVSRETNLLTAMKTIRKLAFIGVGGNALLVAFKLAVGILGNSMAMITDAIHSLSDVLATAIAFVGSRMATREADKTHPYGHERLECLAALALSGILFITGAGIGYAGFNALVSGAWKESTPGLLALAGAVASILLKEAMFRYTLYHAKRIDSAAFKADAWHHRSDALSSVGAFIGIIASRFGIGWGDSVASIVICLFIFKAAYEIARDAMNNMLDAPVDEKTEREIASFIESRPGVERLDILMTRKFGNRFYIDAEIAMDGAMSLREAHRIAESVHDDVEEHFPSAKHIMVHVNPL